MNFENLDVALDRNIEIRNLLSENGKDALIQEIVSGLTSRLAYISSKFFYDDQGSHLFERITNLDEYYPTRTEKEIIRQNASEIMDASKGKNIIEFGSGDCSKISILMDAIPSVNINRYRYMPVDVSRSAILNSAEKLINKHPGLIISGQVLDFTTHIDQLPRNGDAIICFFGSTIGNFDRDDSFTLLKNIGGIMSEGDSLIVGFDMVKDLEILNAAYNDSLGVTDRFNKNILKVVNTIIDSDLDTADFEHVAFFNKTESRMEMHLELKRDIRVHSQFLLEDLQFRKGERIHTENSYKFTPEMISNLAEDAGLVIRNEYSDTSQWFSLIEFKKA